MKERKNDYRSKYKVGNRFFKCEKNKKIKNGTIKKFKFKFILNINIYKCKYLKLAIHECHILV